jgi:hypothetical protein
MSDRGMPTPEEEQAAINAPDGTADDFPPEDKDDYRVAGARSAG